MVKLVKPYFVVILCLSSFLVAAQSTVTRTLVYGKIVVKSADKDGVTVYNTSSKQGTITDEKGNFEIKVALNDVIEFGALQFKDFSITINETILESKQMTVILVEEVNKLDEVILLPYGLTGILDADTESIRTYNVKMDAIYFGLKHPEYFDFEQDYKSKIENLAYLDQNPEVRNMLNLVSVKNLLVDILSLKKNELDQNDSKQQAMRAVLDAYSSNFYKRNFDVSPKLLEDFKQFALKQSEAERMLLSKNELLIIDFLNKQSAAFLSND